MLSGTLREFGGASATFTATGRVLRGEVTFTDRIKYPDGVTVVDELRVPVSIDFSQSAPRVSVSDGRWTQDGVARPGPVEVSEAQWDGKTLTLWILYGATETALHRLTPASATAATAVPPFKVVGTQRAARTTPGPSGGGASVAPAPPLASVAPPPPKPATLSCEIGYSQLRQTTPGGSDFVGNVKMSGCDGENYWRSIRYIVSGIECQGGNVTNCRERVAMFNCSADSLRTVYRDGNGDNWGVGAPPSSALIDPATATTAHCTAMTSGASPAFVKRWTNVVILSHTCRCRDPRE